MEFSAGDICSISRHSVARVASSSWKTCSKVTQGHWILSHSIPYVPRCIDELVENRKFLYTTSIYGHCRKRPRRNFSTPRVRRKLSFAGQQFEAENGNEYLEPHLDVAARFELNKFFQRLSLTLTLFFQLVKVKWRERNESLADKTIPPQSITAVDAQSQSHAV